KPGVILVNTARAAIVDELAMIDALKSGHIRHAGLDVFNVEPLPADHELTKLPNVTLSAHSAFRTPEASENLIDAALEHWRRIAKRWRCLSFSFCRRRWREAPDEGSLRAYDEEGHSRRESLTRLRCAEPPSPTRGPRGEG